MSSILLSITSIEIEYKLYICWRAMLVRTNERTNVRNPNKSSKKLDYQRKEINIHWLAYIKYTTIFSDF